MKSMYDKLVAMFGKSATGGGQLNFGHAINNEWITGASGTDGRVYQCTDLADALYAFKDAYALRFAPIAALPQALPQVPPEFTPIPDPAVQPLISGYTPPVSPPPPPPPCDGGGGGGDGPPDGSSSGGPARL